MKFVTILGLLAATAAGMLALAASALATTLTNADSETTPFIHVVNRNSKHVTLHNSIVNIECQSTVEGKVQKHGGAGVTAFGEIVDLRFNNCTNEWVVDIVSEGSLEVHYTGTGAKHGTGTITSSSVTVTATRAGLSCHFRTNNTPIGHILGGSPAEITISATIERHGGSFLCGGSTAQWTGAYVTTQTLEIDQ